MSEQNKNVYFIILNYNTFHETKNCVTSIRKLIGNYKKNIVIVDNCSPDGSFFELADSYCGSADVEVYQLEENVGVSKANNYAYQMIRKRGDILFCIVCNSDIVFVQQNFLILLEQEYRHSQFFLCGPQIFCPSKKSTFCKGYQSPMYPFEWREGYVKAYHAYNVYKYRMLKQDSPIRIKSLGGVILRWFYWKGVRKFLIKTLYCRYREKRHENVPVHGSCLIISELFMEKEEKIFYPEVRFYGEELLLYLRSRRQQYKIVYEPKLLIHHLQGMSTMSIENERERDLFRYENFAIGAEIYIKQLKNDGSK